MNSIIKTKMTEVEEQFNKLTESIEAKNAEIKKLQKEVFEQESSAIYLKGKYEGLAEALAAIEEDAANKEEAFPEIIVEAE